MTWNTVINRHETVTREEQKLLRVPSMKSEGEVGWFLKAELPLPISIITLIKSIIQAIRFGFLSPATEDS